MPKFGQSLLGYQFITYIPLFVVDYYRKADGQGLNQQKTLCHDHNKTEIVNKLSFSSMMLFGKSLKKFSVVWLYFQVNCALANEQPPNSVLRVMKMLCAHDCKKNHQKVLSLCFFTAKATVRLFHVLMRNGSKKKTFGQEEIL